MDFISFSGREGVIKGENHIFNMGIAPFKAGLLISNFKNLRIY